MKRLVVSLIVVLCLSGCAAFNRLVNEHEFTMQLATEAATARVLHEHPSWKSRTIAITGNAIVLIDAGSVTTLEDLEAYVKGRIPWAKMMPEEQALVSALISEVRKNLEDSLRAKNITVPSEQLVEVKQVLTWINEAAKRQN